MIKATIKKTAGVLFIVLGFLALITPLTPGSWLIFVGLELVGLRLFFNKKLAFYRDKLQKIRIIKKETNESQQKNKNSSA